MKDRSAMLAGFGLLLVALVAVAAVIAGPLSNKIEPAALDTGDNPGFSPSRPGSGVTGRVDDASTTTEPPFQMAAPRGASPSTTIGGVGPTFYVTPTIAPPPSVLATTTTIKSYPTSPFIADPATITSICGLSKSLQYLVSLTRSSSFNDQAVLTAISNNLAKYQEFAPPDAVAAMTALRSHFAQTLTVIAANGWKANSPAVLALVRSNSPPISSLISDLDILAPIEERSCPRS
jgi:hypothetical protein